MRALLVDKIGTLLNITRYSLDDFGTEIKNAIKSCNLKAPWYAVNNQDFYTGASVGSRKELHDRPSQRGKVMWTNDQKPFLDFEPYNGEDQTFDFIGIVVRRDDDDGRILFQEGPVEGKIGIFTGEVLQERTTDRYCRVGRTVAGVARAYWGGYKITYLRPYQKKEKAA